MTVEEIIIKAIKDAGGDGLCSGDCGCGLDDLCPCGCFDSVCEIAKKVIAEENSDSYDKGDEIFVPLKGE